MNEMGMISNTLLLNTSAKQKKIEKNNIKI